MAKSDSFFIRAKVKVGSATYAQSEIDLGSFVNLGVSKSTLLRLHSVEASYTDNSDASAVIYYDGAQPGSLISWQLTTQTQAAIITADDKSVVARGTRYQTVVPAGFSGGVIAAGPVDETQDVNPSSWKTGYLVGTDSMFLGSDASQTLDSGDFDVSLILECTLETATQASSVALALSQQ
ncbi:unnamed protein product [marine sediment metagenome]|uniref:Uncharacterized protein n=1 Tax=marine sediment metagenome TaxID=412755 RepID=X1EMG7_9ZZZZ